jgi:hypothetical protein
MIALRKKQHSIGRASGAQFFSVYREIIYFQQSSGANSIGFCVSGIVFYRLYVLEAHYYSLSLTVILIP